MALLFKCHKHRIVELIYVMELMNSTNFLSRWHHRYLQQHLQHIDVLYAISYSHIDDISEGLYNDEGEGKYNGNFQG